MKFRIEVDIGIFDMNNEDDLGVLLKETSLQLYKRRIQLRIGEGDVLRDHTGAVVGEWEVLP